MTSCSERSQEDLDFYFVRHLSILLSLALKS